jgi:hypothetical protein
MSSTQSNLQHLSVAASTSNGAVQVGQPCPQDEQRWPESRLLEQLRSGLLLTDQDWRALDETLARAPEQSRSWVLLQCCDLAPRGKVCLDTRLDALRRLAKSDSALLRANAYRALADMHRKDLRFEMRAKQVLAQGLETEAGIGRQRLIKLMRGC